MAGKPTVENSPTIVDITLGLPVTHIVCQQRTCDSCENCGKSIGNYDLKRI